MIANIPYNITGPILDIFIGRLGIIRNYNYEKIIFLMQKDVVDRILSKEGSPNAGALSIRMQLLSKKKEYVMCRLHHLVRLQKFFLL